MMAFATVGLLTMGVIFAFGVYWVLTNVTFQNQTPRYTYQKDSEGNEYVKDDNDDE